MDHIDRTIQDFRGKLEHAEQEVLRFKRAINTVCEVGGRPVMFQEAEMTPSISATGAISFANDAFYGKPLATSMKQVLEARKGAGLGVATIDELYQALLEHGYHFEGKEENRKTILRNALRKNPDFHRLPHGGYGLREWYGRIKPSAEQSLQTSVEDGSKMGGESPEREMEGSQKISP